MSTVAPALVGDPRTRRLAAPTSIVLAGSIVSRVLVALRDVLTASRFGTSFQVDALFAGLVVPNLVGTALSGSFQSTSVPLVVEPGCSRVKSVASVVLLWGATACALVTLACVVVGFPVVSFIGSGLDAPTRSLAHHLAVVLAPLVLCGGLVGLLTAILSTEGRYFVLAAGQVLNGVITVGLLAFGSDDTHVAAVATAILAGAVVEVVFLGIFCRAILQRATVAAGAIAAVDHVDGRALYGFLGATATLVGANLLTSLNQVVDQYFAAGLAPGTIAALGYASKLVLTTTAVAGAAAIAITPTLSRLAGAGAYDELAATLRHRAGQLLLVGVALASLLLVTAPVASEIVFGRGAFGRDSAQAVTGPLRAYSLMLPAFIVGVVLVRALTVLGSTRAVLLVAAGNVALNVVGDWLMSDLMGASGIALSTATVQTTSALILYRVLNRRLAKFGVERA